MKEERQVSPYVLEREIPREISLDMFDPRARDLEDNGFVDVRRLLQILSKRRLLIALVMLLFCMLAVYRNMIGPPSYVASTVIRIDPTTPEFIKLSDASAPVADSTYYETEYAVLSSAPLAVRVIDALKLYDDTRFTSKPQIEDPITRFQRTANRRAGELVERVKDKVIGPKAEEPPPSRADGRAFEYVDQYLADLTIIPDRTSRLVSIRYTSLSPELSAEISRTHAQEFIKMNVEARGNVNTEAQTFLEARLDDVKKRMEASEATLNQFRRDHRVLAVGGNEKENVTLERLSALNTDYSAAKGERIALEAQYMLVKKRAYGNLASVQRDPIYNELRTQLENLKSEHAKLAQIYQPAYPKMVALANEIAVTEGRLNGQIHSAVAGVESQYLAAKEKEEALASAVDKERQATLDLNDLNAQFEVVKRDADANRELYNNLLTHVKQTDVRETMKTSNVSIVEPARVPAYPAARAGKSFGKALLIGFILGFAIAFVIEYLDDRLQTPDQVEAELHIPALAVIPAFHCEGMLPDTNDRRQRLSMREPIVRDAGEGTGQSDDPKRKLALPMVRRLVSRHQRTPKHGREAGSDALVVVTRRKSLVAEAYRTLRTAMLLSSADRPPQVMQITSAQSREGKTVTTVNTAATLAQSGAKVLVIDADLRRPRCHRVLMTEIAPGLVDCLVGHSSFEACVRSIRYQPSANGASGNGPHDNSGALFDGCLDLMTAGTRPPNPAEILGSERMGEMLTMVRQRYDYILIDTPPVLPVADAVLLSRLVDGVLVVVNGTITPRGLVREAIKRLRRVKAPIMGVALNEVDVVKGDYHYYYRTYYSSYEYVDTRNA